MSLLSRRTLMTAGAATLLTGPALAAAGTYKIPSHHQARIVRIKSSFAPGEIHVDPGQYALYWTLDGGKAIRYPVGIGTQERYVSGTFHIARRRNDVVTFGEKCGRNRKPDAAVGTCDQSDRLVHATKSSK